MAKSMEKKHEELLKNSKSGIILAADVVSISALKKLVKIAIDVPEVLAVKVGFSLALRFGLPRVVKSIKSISNLAVIYDHQKAATDIPQTGGLFAEACYEAGVDGVIFFPQSGPKTLAGFVTAALERNLIPIVGLVMTHPAYLKSEGGYIVDEAPELMAKASIELGVTHFVLPGTKPDVVARFSQGPLTEVKNATIMMPGIGSQGGSLATAFKAAQPHGPFAIIGSAIYAAKDPKQVLANFAMEVRSCQSN
jgi:orotidine-5'-phosphate decarboxylase